MTAIIGKIKDLCSRQIRKCRAGKPCCRIGKKQESPGSAAMFRDGLFPDGVVRPFCRLRNYMVIVYGIITLAIGIVGIIAINFTWYLVLLVFKKLI